MAGLSGRSGTGLIGRDIGAGSRHCRGRRCRRPALQREGRTVLGPIDAVQDEIVAQDGCGIEKGQPPLAIRHGLVGEVQADGDLCQLELAFHVGQAVGLMPVDPCENLSADGPQQIEKADVVASQAAFDLDVLEGTELVQDGLPVIGGGPAAHRQEIAQSEVSMIVEEELSVLIERQVDEIVLVGGHAIPAHQDVEAVQVAMDMAHDGPQLQMVDLLRRADGEGQGVGIPASLERKAGLLGRKAAAVPQKAVQAALLGIEPIGEPAAQQGLRRLQARGQFGPAVPILQ